MQEAIAGLIVSYACWVVIGRYAPKAAKRAVRSRLARAARRYGWTRLEQKFQNEATTAAAGCSDGCSSCGACYPSEQRASAALPPRAIPIKVQKEPASHC